MGQYDLPPVPPNGVFDLRFESQRSAELFSPYSPASAVQISEGEEPVSFTWDVGESNEHYYLEVVDGNNRSMDYKLSGKGSSVIDASNISRMLLHHSAARLNQVPQEFSLDQNYPNPFNPTTMIRFTIIDSRFTTLRVYNVLGQVVATLVNEVEPPGAYTVQWDASASGGLPSGIYYYKLSAGQFTDTKKMVLVK